MDEVAEIAMIVACFRLSNTQDEFLKNCRTVFELKANDFSLITMDHFKCYWVKFDSETGVKK